MGRSPGHYESHVLTQKEAVYDFVRRTLERGDNLQAHAALSELLGLTQRRVSQCLSELVSGGYLVRRRASRSEWRALGTIYLYELGSVDPEDEPIVLRTPRGVCRHCGARENIHPTQTGQLGTVCRSCRNATQVRSRQRLRGEIVLDESRYKKPAKPQFVREDVSGAARRAQERANAEGITLVEALRREGVI